MVFSPVVVFEIDIQYLGVHDPERQPPIACNVETPDSLAAAGKLVGLPQWESAQLFGVPRILQESQHRAELVDGIRIFTLHTVAVALHVSTVLSAAKDRQPGV
jgi:hypothetical protein